MEVKKLGLLFQPYNLVVEKIHSKDRGDYYEVYSSGSSVFYFFLMIPIIGNIIAFVCWLMAVLNKKYIVSGKKEKDIVFSSIE